MPPDSPKAGEIPSYQAVQFWGSTSAFAEIILTEAQLQEQLDYLQTALYDDGTIATIRLYATIYFSCCTGARRSELVKVRRRDLHLDDCQPTVNLLKRKGRKDSDLIFQKMVLPQKILPILRRLLKLIPKEQQCIFAPNDNHLLEDGFDQELERSKAEYLGKKIREALKGSKWENCAGWHIYRHTLASRLLDRGYTKTEVMEFIGWCSDEIAQKYQHQTFDRKAEIINSII